MNSRERVIHAILGAPIERYPCGPLAVHCTAKRAGVSLRDYTLDARTLASCVVRYYEEFKPDAVWISADTWVTAQAMGAAVAFAGDDQPMCGTGEHLVKTRADIERIAPAESRVQGRWPLMCDALSQVKQQLGREVFVVGCFDQSPFSLAAALMGMENLMVKAVDDPAFVNSLLDRCIEYAVCYALALANVGADMLSTGDSVAGLIGGDMYRTIAMPAEQRMFEEIRSGCDALLSLHICGDTSHILKDMAQTGCDVLEIDSKVNIIDAMDKVAPDIALWGNLNPVDLLQAMPREIERQAMELLRLVRQRGRTRFILSSGCTLAPGTPPENIRALIGTAAAADAGYKKVPR